MSFKLNEEEGRSALGVSLCDRHGALQMSVIINAKVINTYIVPYSLPPE